MTGSKVIAKRLHDLNVGILGYSGSDRPSIHVSVLPDSPVVAIGLFDVSAERVQIAGQIPLREPTVQIKVRDVGFNQAEQLIEQALAVLDSAETFDVVDDNDGTTHRVWDILVLNGPYQLSVDEHNNSIWVANIKVWLRKEEGE